MEHKSNITSKEWELVKEELIEHTKNCINPLCELCNLVRRVTGKYPRWRENQV